jgi:hypothetical protein
MAVPIFPPNSRLLYSMHLLPYTYMLVGNIPDQYNDNIAIYLANDAPYNTVTAEVVITKYNQPSDKAVFNKTMYIPARNMAKMINFSNLAGLNVFAKTSGQYTHVYILYVPDSEDTPFKVAVTPTPVNVDQTILPFPTAQDSNSGGIGTQLLQLKAQVSTLTNQINQLLANQAAYENNINNQIGTLSLLIDSLSKNNTE